MGGNVEREQLKKVYPSKTWAKKVDNMSDQQITAIYIRLQSERKLGR